MGPVHLQASAARVEAMLEEAEHLGAKVVRPAPCREGDVAPGGYFVSPALVVRPPPTARHVTEEQFAPALPVLGYRDLEQAVAMANDTEFGLSASMWSSDVELASSVAGRLEAGTVFVNATGCRPWTRAPPWAGGSRRVSVSSWVPRGCGPSPVPRCCLPTPVRARADEQPSGRV